MHVAVQLDGAGWRGWCAGVRAAWTRAPKSECISPVTDRLATGTFYAKRLADDCVKPPPCISLFVSSLAPTARSCIFVLVPRIYYKASCCTLRRIYSFDLHYLSFSAAKKKFKHPPQKPHCNRAQISRKERISLAPEFFGGDVHERLFELLKKKVEGVCHGVYGYTIFVV